MNIIPPITITDAIFDTSSVTEPSPTESSDADYQGEYNAGSSYSINAIVLVSSTHTMYQSLQNANIGHTPGGTGNETWWLDVGKSERWSVFDGIVGTQASASASISYSLDPGEPIDSLALLNIECETVTVTMTDVGGTGATITWIETVLVDGLFISDVVKTDFPLTYLTPHIVVQLAYAGGTVKVGEIIIGQKKSIGSMRTQPSVGIIDYSIKEVDDFGNYTILERAYSKRLSCTTYILNTLLDATYNILAGVRAIPCVWVGSEDYASMIVFGFYKDFTIEIAYLKYSICTVEIEGLV